MASTTPNTANYSHSEIPPWKIELIQRKKKLFGNINPNPVVTTLNTDSNAGKSITNHHFIDIYYLLYSYANQAFFAFNFVVSTN